MSIDSFVGALVFIFKTFRGLKIAREITQWLLVLTFYLAFVAKVFPSFIRGAKRFFDAFELLLFGRTILFTDTNLLGQLVNYCN